MRESKFLGLSGVPPRLIVVGVLLIAISAIAYRVLGDAGQHTVYASFLFLDGSREWKPVDISRSIENIEALQEMENESLQNMILELDTDPYSSPTDEELERLWQLYKDSFESAERNGWLGYENAVKDGFYDDEMDPYHYPHEKYLTDDQALVPGKPEFLMYYPHPEKEGEKILAGFMYQQSEFDNHGEQVGGSHTRWHKHIYGSPVCFGPDMVPRGLHIQGECDGVRSSESPEMLHVWFVDHPVSQFASGMSLGSDLIKSPVMMSRDDFMQKHRGLPVR